MAILLFINLLWMNHSITLWDEDEAAYAGFAQQMLATGDWVEPSYPWSEIHRKTPLHFWTIAASFKLLGVHEFALRLPSVLAILLTCFLVFRWGRHLFGALTAKRAAVILATSIQLPLMGKIAFTDATLLLFETMAVLALLNYLERPNWKWNLALWLGIALGVLTKGPPILLLTGGMWILLALFHPKRRNLLGTHPWILGVVALLPFAAWCYASYSQDYQAWQALNTSLSFEEWWQQRKNGHIHHLLPFLWDWYVLKRVGGAVLGQTAPPGYHFIILTIAFLPWLPLWGMTLRKLFSSFVRPAPKDLYLLIWVVMAWFFWELMSSKLPSYAMGAQPALALITASQLEKLETDGFQSPWFKSFFLLYSLIFLTIIIGLPIAGHYYLGDIGLWTLLPMSVVLALLLAGLFFIIIKEPKPKINKSKAEQCFQQLAWIGGSFMFLLWTCVGSLIEQSPIKALEPVAAKVQELSHPEKNTRIILTGLDIKQQKISLLFYLKNYIKTYEEQHAAAAFQAYESPTPTVLVIGQDYLKELKATFKAAKLPFKATEIPFYSTDDALRPHNFWIIANSATQDK